jgi:hypothetical protein
MQGVGNVESALHTREKGLQLAAPGSQLVLWYGNEATNKLFWDVKTREMFGAPLDGEVTLETFSVTRRFFRPDLTHISSAN